LRGGKTRIGAGASLAGTGAADAGAVPAGARRSAIFDVFCLRAFVRARRREDLLISDYYPALEGQVEWFKPAARGRPVSVHFADARMTRSATRGLEQPFELRPWPFGDELNRSVVAISNPSSKPKRVRFTHKVVAKSDPLDIPPHNGMKALRLHDWYIVPRMAASTSSIVAIGDELVGGFTLDTNSHWLAERLRLLGYPVKRVTAIRDRHVEIVEQLRRELADVEVTDVFVSGGLGPTPDDRTFAAVAEALGRELIIWEETRARIERRVRRMHEAGLLESPDITEGNLRMARIPADPALVFKNRRGMAPGVVYEAEGKRVFVLPGVPLELKGIVTEEIEPQFLSKGSAAAVRELRFMFAVEARFYPLMRELEERFPDVSVGSYPNFETKELVIRCLGTDPKRVEEVLDVIRRRSAEMGMAAERR
jgi:nicotinamide-nucleotide amidase